jgi:hypothetical protein
MSMRAIFPALIFLLALAGCAVQQPVSDLPPPNPQPAHPLPFKGRLVNGNPQDLPPAVAMSLANDSPVTFSYREELTHDDYHLPLIVTALDPVTYAGAPVGDRGVSAFASLTVSKGDHVIGDYTAKAYISKSYSVYSEPPHAQLEREARDAVRQRIDDKLYSDSDRLSKLISAAGPPPNSVTE